MTLQRRLWVLRKTCNVAVPKVRQRVSALVLSNTAPCVFEVAHRLGSAEISRFSRVFLRRPHHLVIDRRQGHSSAAILAPQKTPDDRPDRLPAVLDATQSVDLALSPCSRLQTGRPGIDISPGESEIGTGLCGEPGMWRGPLAPAYAVVSRGRRAGRQGLVDARLPAGRAAAVGVVSRPPLDAEGTRRGIKATRDLGSRRGRLAKLGTWPLGHVDPIAASTDVILAAMREKWPRITA